MNGFLHKIQKLKLYIETIEGLVISKINQHNNPNFECTKTTKRCCDNKQSASFKYYLTESDIPECCATHLVNILKDVSNTLEKNNAQYFISFGTLLGSVRHGGIIPWDTDIDIIIAKNDQEKIYQILLDEFKEDYYIKIDEDISIVGGKLIRVYYSKINKLHVDLFSYSETETEVSFYTQKLFKKESIFPLKKTNFYNLRLFAPNNIEDHLHTLYGDDNMIYGYKQWAANNKKFKIENFDAAIIKRLDE